MKVKSECHDCGAEGAEYDCNGLKFCGWECFVEWDRRETESMDQFAKEYEDQYIQKSPTNCAR